MKWTGSRSPAVAVRTKPLLEGSILPKLLRLAAPNVLSLLAFRRRDHARSAASLPPPGIPAHMTTRTVVRQSDAGRFKETENARPIGHTSLCETDSPGTIGQRLLQGTG